MDILLIIDDLLFKIGGAVITGLLVIIAYFLREIHSDFKQMRTGIEKINKWVAVKDSLFKMIEDRIARLEQKVFE